MIGQIKFFWNLSGQSIPNGYLLCDGSGLDSQQSGSQGSDSSNGDYELLDEVLSFNPNYNGRLPNCEDRVIIRYSGDNDIPFGSKGGKDDLPEFTVKRNHDLIIKHDKQECDFRMFYLYASTHNETKCR